MQTDELSEHLDALRREECYRVDAVLKESVYEITQRVMFVGRNGAEQGPFIRKYINRASGLGGVYRSMREAQRYGKRFRFLPRVIDCYTLGEDDVVVMEYVWGETLQDAVYRCDPSVAFAADVFPRLCDAVLELHEGFDTPIIHRDLKPSNIMISRDSITIIDLGIARFYKDDATDDTRHFGTRAYAPPEQFGYGQTTVRSDVYALGMLLYFCLAEKTPDARVREEGFYDARIPEPMRAVLLRATEFDPERRFSDVRALRDAFCAAARSCGYGSIAQAACGPLPAARPLATMFCRRLIRACCRRRPCPLARLVLRPSAAKAVSSAWNTAVVAAAALLLFGCIMAAFSPNERDLACPLWFRVLEYLVVGFSCIVFLAFLFIDKRGLYGRFPRFPRFSWWRQALFVVLYTLFAFGLLGQIASAIGA